MSNKLRDLIKAVRACKTAAEERAIVAKESAAIRSAIKDNEEGYRHRNVAKLLYIHMLGYPTHWGQMECVKLLASHFYSDKRIGYLALMLLLDENQEVLTLVTNCIKNDLNNANQFITGLALCALGNVSSAGMVRDLAPEVEKLLGSTNPYIRKKAALCAIRVLRKCPDLMENFVPRIRALLSEKSHGVLLTGVTLMIELCETDPHNIEYFKKLVSSLVRILKNLVMSGYAPEYDVSGITDPFLQVKILRLLRYLGKGDSEASDQMNDVLAQIATNTDHSRNVGNSILYECVQTILSIEAENGLRVLAINVLGKFLLNRDNNIRYVALTTLTKVVSADIDAVQRHRNTIVDCLKDPDLSIRRRALDLIYALVDDSNIKVLAHELLSFLQSANPELRADLAVKLCNVTERFSPNKRWHVDTILRIMSIAGNYVPDETSSTLLNLIASSPELHSYAVQKMFLSISNDYQQQRLVQVAAWTIGEFGDLLVSSGTTQEITVTEKDVLDLIEKILKSATTTAITKEYILTALMKLSSRFNNNSLERIKSLISYYQNNIDVELQSRACEYSTIFKWESIRKSLLERIPVVVDEKSSISKSTELPVTSNPNNNKNSSKSLIDDWEAEMLGPSPVSTNKPITTTTTTAATTAPITASTSNPGDDLMAALFGPAPTPTPSVTSPVIPNVFSTPIDPLAELLGGPSVPSTSTPSSNNAFGMPNVATSSPASQISPIVAFQKNGLTITFDVSKQPNAPNVASINTQFANSLSVPIQNFEFKVAVPKYIKLQVNPPSSNMLPPNSNNVTQSLKTMNTLQHEGKPLLMKLKIDYTVNGQPVSEFGDVTFPSNV